MGFFKGHTTTTRANKISEFTVSTAGYGDPVPEILGTTRISGNVIYYDDFTAHEHRETQRTGKGGGGSKSVSITYTYTVAVIVGLCEGPVQGVNQVWISKDIYTYPNDKIQLTLFSGTQNQSAWAYTAGKHPDKALPYPGLAYMAGVIDLGDSGSMPNFNFEVQGQLLSTGDGTDVNPADYIRYVLDKVGLSDAEIIGLDNYRQYCKEADMLISTPPDTSNDASARDTINEIATITNAYIFWSNDKFKIVPLEDRDVGSWKPNRTIQYDLTPDDFLPQSEGALVTYQRKDSSEVYNKFPVEFINRSNGYEKESVSYALTDDIADFGLRQANTTNAHYLYTKERAVKLAEQLARSGKYGKNKYTFKLDWSFCRLEVGDLVTLTDPNCGLDKQVVLIDSVTEGTDGIITFTAVSRPEGDYTAAKYNVHATDRPYINYNVTAPDTDKPVIIQPPADLTTSGLELWIGAKGTGTGWGGCDVYVSDDTTNYRLAGQITNTARIGTLVSAVSGTDTTIEVNANGSFLSGTEQDAERANTLCWLNGECLSYQTATLLATGNYQLTGCIRGQYNTTAAQHAAGETFARMDATLLKIGFRKEDVGKTIWLKFVSFNIFGAGNQDMSEVQAYESTLLPYYIPPVTDITAYNRYRQLSDGVSRYDIVVAWNPPDLQSYMSGQVWYKTNHLQASNIVVKEGIAADNLGFDGDWIFGGSGKNQVVIPQAIVGDIYRIAVCTKDEWGAETSPDTAPSKDILVAMKTTTPNVPDGFGITFGTVSTVSWNEVTNTDIAWYEVRLDDHPGLQTDGLLATTTSTQTIIPLTERSGTLYLYAKNALGKYSDAAILQYNKAKPKRPGMPAVNESLGGFGVRVESIPSGCIGMNVYINDEVNIRTVNNTLAYTCPAGLYNVSAAFYDLFGEGEKSPAASVVVKIEIDETMIKDEAISLAKVDAAIAQALKDGKAANTNVIQLVQNLNDTKNGIDNYSALVQMADTINLRVKSDEVINQINISPESILINGKRIHITGDTYFDDNVIVGKMLAANTITADRLAAQDIVISANTATGIVGGAVRLDENGLTTVCDNGTSVLFNNSGMSFKDSNGNKFAGIGRFCTGTATDGQYVKFTNAWDVTPSVIVIPMEIQTSDSSYEHVNIYQRIYPYNISTSGFNVRCQSILGSGSSSSTVSTNQQLWYVDARNTGYYVKSNTDWRTDGSYTYTYLNSITYLTFTLSWSKSDILDSDNRPYRSAYGDTYLSVTTSDGNTVNFGKIFSFADAGYSGYQNGPYSGTWSAGLTVPQGGNITFNLYTISKDSASGDYMNGRCYTETVKLTGISYKASGETVLKQGKVMFIATDPNSIGYTVS